MILGAIECPIVKRGQATWYYQVKEFLKIEMYFLH